MEQNNGIDMIFEMKKSELWEEIQELQREEITRAVEKERERFTLAEKDKEYTIDYFEHEANETRKKYIEELDKVLAIYKRALELACEDIRDMYCSDYCSHTKNESCKEKCCYAQEYAKEKFLNQAKEELEKEE